MEYKSRLRQIAAKEIPGFQYVSGTTCGTHEESDEWIEPSGKGAELGMIDLNAAPSWGATPWEKHSTRLKGHSEEECTVDHYLRQLRGPCDLPQPWRSSEAGQVSREDQMYCRSLALQMSEATVTWCSFISPLSLMLCLHLLKTLTFGAQ